MNKLFKGILTAVLLLSLGAGAVAAGTPLSGPQILATMDEAMGAQSKVMTQNMTIVAANGQERTREMQMWSRQVQNGDEMLAKFLAPADVRGTGILMKDDDMWLYLPALGKTRRVAAHAKKGSFMGSDLTFDDMEQLGSRGFTPFYRADLVGEGEAVDSECFVLELVPLEADNAFSRLKVWVDKSVFLPRQIEYYDETGRLQRVLSTYNLSARAGRWQAERMVMEDLVRGTKTILQIKEVRLDEDLDASLFTTRSLERGI